MITPEYLNAGDKVGLVATARWITDKELEPFQGILKDWELIPVLADNIFRKEHQLAGSAEERITGLKSMFEDDDIKAVFCVRGGYGTVHLANWIESGLKSVPPKWLVGFSDATVLHAFFQKKLNMESIHGLMPYSIRDTHEIDPSSVESLKKALFGSKLDYAFPAHKLNQTGTTRGQLMGGNLSVLYSLTGTNFLSPTKGTILFLEDVDEYLYHIDRMMYNLKLGGFLDHLNGMIIGHMTGMNDNDIPFGKDAYQIIHDIVSEYDFPVCYGFPAGHENPNLALILGRQVELTVEEESCRIVFSD